MSFEHWTGWQGDAFGWYSRESVDADGDGPEDARDTQGTGGVNCEEANRQSLQGYVLCTTLEEGWDAISSE